MEVYVKWTPAVGYDDGSYELVNGLPLEAIIDISAGGFMLLIILIFSILFILWKKI